MAASPKAAATSQDNGSYIHPSGLTVIMEPVGVPANLAEVYAAALAVAESQPNDYGYPMIQDGNVLLPAVSSTAKALEKSNRTASAQQLRDFAKALNRESSYDPGTNVTSLIKVSAISERLSAMELDELNNAVFDLRDNPSIAPGLIKSTGIDASGRIVVTVTELTDDLASALVKRYGTEDIVIEIDQSFGATTNASRAQDSSPYKGGAHYVTPSKGGCSTAFSWIDGSVQMMLTAGHCAPSGGTVTDGQKTMGTIANSSRESWDAGVGTVYMSGQSVLRGDIALIQLSSGLSSAGAMYRGGTTSTTSSTVGEIWSSSPSIGDQFCTGGAASGEICGWKVDQIKVNVMYDDSTVLRNGTRGTGASSSIIPGDSGGIA